MFNLQTVNDMEGFDSTKGGFNGTILPEGSGGGGEGTDNYNELSNKPQINGHTLSGNKTASDLGLASAEDLEGKYEKPTDGIPATDFDEDVQSSLVKAESALQSTDITDNLTTDDATKALSAKQGKALKQMIDAAIGENSHFLGIFATSAELPSSTELASWALVGSDIDALNAYVYTDAWAQFGTKTYDFTDFSNSAVSVDSILDSELSISDENGFVIAKFVDGHIKTKNFDSRLVGKNVFEGKQLCVVGDSISTYIGYLPANYGHYYPKGDVDDVSKCWWYIVANSLGMVINNCSYTGSRVSGDSTNNDTVEQVTGRGACGCSNNRITALGRMGVSPDYIIITLGTNDFNGKIQIGNWDEKKAVPSEGVITTFSEAYALMLKKMQTAYPHARIMCCTILAAQTGDTDADPQFPNKNTNGDSIKDFNDCIKRIADIFCCDVIDLQRCGISFYNISSYTVAGVDQWPNLHPNAAGQSLMAKKVKKEMLSKL